MERKKSRGVISGRVFFFFFLEDAAVNMYTLQPHSDARNHGSSDNHYLPEAGNKNQETLLSPPLDLVFYIESLA